MTNNKRNGIVVHIDRLVLDGIPLYQADSPRFQRAIEGELAQLLREGGISHDLMTGGPRPNLPDHSPVLTMDKDSKIAGKQIAKEVYRRIGI